VLVLVLWVQALCLAWQLVLVLGPWVWQLVLGP